MEYIVIVVKTIMYYFLLTFIFRIMGKREVGQMGTFDLVVYILIAELVAMGIEHDSDLFIQLIPIMILGTLQILFAKISLKSNLFRKIVDGNPSVIIKNGIISFKEMIKQRYTLDDLLQQLRENKIKSIEEVGYAILENNGSLSVFEKDDKNFYPLPLIVDGKIEKTALKDINKSERWLNMVLYKKNIDLKNVFYAFNKDNELYIIKKSDIK